MPPPIDDQDDQPSITIDFWFAIGSTYTYLSILRLAAVSRRTGVRFRWLPFNVRDIMVEMNNIPFSTKPVKAAYMWRDIERRAARHRLPFAGKPPYPTRDLARANRVALVAAREGWIEAYGPAIYREYFLGRRDPASDEAIRAACAHAGQDGARVIALAEGGDIGRQLAEQTQAARALGIFGAPTWVVGSEIFWGDDRLEDAVAWARERASPARQ